MTKEEKKAYKILKYQKNYVDIKTLFKEIDVILDLVDKQQKEIEMLKAITKQYDSYKVEYLDEGIEIVFANSKYFDNGTFVQRYVSKDKIREKIKELERLNKEQEIPVLKEYKFIRKEMIKYFKDLLQE